MAPFKPQPSPCCVPVISFEVCPVELHTASKTSDPLGCWHGEWPGDTPLSLYFLQELHEQLGGIQTSGSCQTPSHEGTGEFSALDSFLLPVSLYEVLLLFHTAYSLASFLAPCHLWYQAPDPIKKSLSHPRFWPHVLSVPQASRTQDPHPV